MASLDGTDRPSPARWSEQTLIDAHVHLYDCFDRVTFFDGALKNFRRAAGSLGLPETTHGVMLLAETPDCHAFESLIAAHELDGGRWRFHPSAEGCSLVAALDGRDVMTAVAGRQVVSREGLEVLALCCTAHLADGRSAERTIEKVIESDGLPVLPYGVGKWRGVRGKLVRDLVNGPLGSRLMLGDNAGRLRLSGEPALFAEARRGGVWVLPGTDPLPFADQASRVGRYGMVLTGAIDRDRPASSVRHLVCAADTQPKTYGRSDGLWTFLKLQVGMQLRKRLTKR